MYKKRAARAELLFCQSKPIAFFAVLVDVETSSQILEHQHARRNVKSVQTHSIFTKTIWTQTRHCEDRL